MNNTYYTGTTLENWLRIMADGYVRINPPHRVWKDTSEAYVYLIPADAEKEDGEPFELCLEQSDFALSVLGGTKRVVLEIEGLDEAQLKKDADGPEESVAYSQDIPLEKVKHIFVEQSDISREVKELVALTHFVQRQSAITPLDLEYAYLDSDHDAEAVYGLLNISNIHLVPVRYLIDEEELSAYYMDKIEKVDRGIPMDRYTVQSFRDAMHALTKNSGERPCTSQEARP